MMQVPECVMTAFFALQESPLPDGHGIRKANTLAFLSLGIWNSVVPGQNVQKIVQIVH